MAFSRRALAGAVVLLTACGSPSFTTSGDGGDVTDGGTSGSDGAAGDGAADDGSLDAAAGGPLVCPGAQPSGSCDLKSVCCLYRPNNGGGFLGSCQTGTRCTGQPAGTNGDPPVQLACTRSTQCGGVNVCCIVKNGGNEATSACTTLPQCTANNGAVLCEMSHPTCPLSLNPCGTGSDSSWGIPQDLGTCGGVPPK